MKPLALIIEDDPAIREALADRLDSLGHDHHSVGSQNEARERLSRCSYDYILLDLELPVRYGRPPSIPTGRNLLTEIRSDPRHATRPVLVVTAHGHDRPDLAVELMKAGASDFVKKPFENLDLAIREAMQGRPSGLPATTVTRPDPAQERRTLEGAELVLYVDRLELAGISICGPDNGLIWRILVLLRARRPDGRPKAFSGKAIAERLGVERGQNGICDAVSPFRRRLVQLLDAHGIEAADDSLIVTGKLGYELNGALHFTDNSDEPSSSPALPQAPAAEDRQKWFLDELQKGRKLRREDLERKFSVSTATAKRDLGVLSAQVEFTGTGKHGVYTLKRAKPKA
ncbi:MAG: response regulator [Verrucomicrobiales bacterium]|nr:response regulator [Verrucomicrobiales bacterium]